MKIAYIHESPEFIRLANTQTIAGDWISKYIPFLRKGNELSQYKFDTGN